MKFRRPEFCSHFLPGPVLSNLRNFSGPPSFFNPQHADLTSVTSRGPVSVDPVILSVSGLMKADALTAQSPHPAGGSRRVATELGDSWDFGSTASVLVSY